MQTVRQLFDVRHHQRRQGRNSVTTPSKEIIMANRVAEVNRALKARGIEEKLTRGEGYYYFRDGNAAEWRATSVYVYRADAFTVDQWLAEWSDLSGRAIP